MRHNPVLVEDTRAWFRKVQLDLRSAEAVYGAKPPILEDVLFHCQQATEKAMKGFLTWHQREFGKTHDLRQLGKECAGIDAGLVALTERAMVLTKYAWELRYPGAPTEPTEAQAQEALSLARELVSGLLDRLPEDVR